jgi:hypothetical protein
MNWDKAVESAKIAYDLGGYKPPKDNNFLRFRSPRECAIAQDILIVEEPSFFDRKDLQSYVDGKIKEIDEDVGVENYKINKTEVISHQIYGFQDAGWLALYDFIGDILEEDVSRLNG